MDYNKVEQGLRDWPVPNAYARAGALAIAELRAELAKRDAVVGQDALDAQRFRKLCALLQKAYDGEPIEVDNTTIYCSMLSGFKHMRNVEARLCWTDARDEPLDLASALDKISE